MGGSPVVAARCNVQWHPQGTPHSWRHIAPTVPSPTSLNDALSGAPITSGPSWKVTRGWVFVGKADAARLGPAPRCCHMSQQPDPGGKPTRFKNKQDFPFSWFIASVGSSCGCFYCRFLNYLLANRLLSVGWQRGTRRCQKHFSLPGPWGKHLPHPIGMRRSPVCPFSVWI